MGYEIKYDDISNVRNFANVTIDLWKNQLDDIQNICQNMKDSTQMEGQTADSIDHYIRDVHCNIIKNILQMLEEYRTRLAVYEEGFRDIDGAPDAHITQEVLEEKLIQLQEKREEFGQLNESIQSVLDEISDICYIARPANGNIEMGFQQAGSQLEKLNDQVGSYENSHLTDCQPIRDYIQRIRTFINGLSGKGQVAINTYKVGTALGAPAYQMLNQYYDTSSTYTGLNKATMNAVKKRMKEEIQAEIRKEKGKVKIVNGIVTIGGTIIGVVAIVGSGGMAAPAVAAWTASGVATVTLHSSSNIYEGADMYRLSLAGDANSVAYNPIRDTVFQGNQTAYDIWGLAGNTLFMTGSMANAVTDTSKTNITVMKGMADRAKGTGSTVRDQLLNKVENTKLKNAVNEVYRVGASVGDGGLADAVRHELSTGELVGGKSHIQKAIERVTNLENIIKKQSLSSGDLEIAEKLLDDLKKALGGE